MRLKVRFQERLRGGPGTATVDGCRPRLYVSITADPPRECRGSAVARLIQKMELCPFSFKCFTPCFHLSTTTVQYTWNMKWMSHLQNVCIIVLTFLYSGHYCLYIYIYISPVKIWEDSPQIATKTKLPPSCRKFCVDFKNKKFTKINRVAPFQISQYLWGPWEKLLWKIAFYIFFFRIMQKYMVYIHYHTQ